MKNTDRLLNERDAKIKAGFFGLLESFHELDGTPIGVDNQHRPVTQVTEDDRGQYEDFFTFIEQNPAKGTFSTVYYTAVVKMNKNIKNTETGEKSPNPMAGKALKHQRMSFRWEDTYKRAVERTNPEHEFGARSGTYEKVSGYDMIESGKSGLYLPILPDVSKTVSNYSVDGQVMSKEEIYPYMPPQRPYTPSSGVHYRQLILDRIYMVNSGGNTWTNPHFQFDGYLGPK